MFVNEFFFSFFLLAFTGLLLLGGTVLLFDSFRRIFTDAYKGWRQAQSATPPATAPIESKEEITFKEAA
jgi:hypothetical protein